MSDARFHIVFSGKLVGGADLATVKSNLGRLFKMDSARVEKLFSGQPVVIKKDADQATAMKFRALMKQAGAECEIRPVSGGGQARAPAQPAAAPSAVPAPATESSASAESTSLGEQNSGDLETVGTIRTGGTGFSGAFSVADVGEDMNNSEHAPAPPAPDVSHLSMAAAGEDLGQRTQAPPPAQPDISYLSLKDD
ncbi:hypothetical protein [Alcanivorax sp.]|uniref:hypothetical protein n=1 Tax=Alcanivorax sp. TaxID=1872427 RepID=UPI000C66DE3A|nr:hypothetical protein [Alcanivorax sp.]MBQ25464.1 hypothetical protein [Alcanivorax sp.]|tara:strand:- start:1605 stop:2189 length:585 start_codon:yes stop_codon:yes gene_type:complete